MSCRVFNGGIQKSTYVKEIIVQFAKTQNGELSKIGPHFRNESFLKIEVIENVNTHQKKSYLIGILKEKIGRF